MQQKILSLAVGILASTFLLTACGSGGASTTGANAPVTSADSPIPNTTGVKTTLDDGTQVYLLSENTNADETKSMKIVSDPNKTGGDTSELVGKTFLEFEVQKSQYEKAVVTGSTSNRVFQCDIETRKCIVITTSPAGSGQISFDVEGGKFYAIKK